RIGARGRSQERPLEATAGPGVDVGEAELEVAELDGRAVAVRADGEPDDQLLALTFGDAAEHHLLATEARVPLAVVADDLDQADAGAEAQTEPEIASDGPLNVEDLVTKQRRDGVGLLDELKVAVGLLGQAREQDLVVLEAV